MFFLGHGGARPARSRCMARKARVEFEGAVYYVLDRGGRREYNSQPASGVPAETKIKARVLAS